MAELNNTTTVLNPGVGGDTMDESLVSQTVDSTQPAVTALTGKRPRTVMADDAGNVIEQFAQEGTGHVVPVQARGVEEKLDDMLDLLVKINAKLAKMSNMLP